jgi:predicted AAA+ superfamily ATPase
MNDEIIDRFVTQTPILMKEYTIDSKGPLPKRLALTAVKKSLENVLEHGIGQPRVILITGLRGVGKTTIMFQLMQEKLSEGWPLDKVLYLPMDQALLSGKTIMDLIGEYERSVVRGLLSKAEGKFLFFIDEAQYSPDWDLQIKVLSDSVPNAVFLVSGSSAVQMDISADLARRATVHVVNPLSFLEQLMLPKRILIDQEILDRYSSCLFHSKGPDELVSNYPSASRPLAEMLREGGGYDPGTLEGFLMDGGMPWISTDRSNRRRMYDIVERIVEKDLPKIGEHDPHTLRAVPRILSLIAPSPGISNNSIANDLDSVGLTSVRRVMDTLVKSQLIFEVPSLGSVRSAGRNETRKYYSSPGLASAIIDATGFDPRRFLGPLAECAVASVLKRHIQTIPGAGLYHISGKGQADFVLEIGGRRMVIEVGMGRKDDGYGQVSRSMRIAGSDLGIIVSASGGLDRKRNIVRIPMREFLCI